MMRALGLCLLLGASFVPAQATEYTYSATIDLSEATYQYDNYGDETIMFALPAPDLDFQFQSGDTVSGTISFTGDISLTQTDVYSSPMQLSFAPTTPSPYSLAGSDSFQLMGTAGDANPDPVNGTFRSSGLSDTSLLINTGPDSTVSGSFTGFAYSATFTVASDSSGSFAPQNLTILVESGNSASASVAPEPGTWSLMLGGLSLLAFWRRRVTFPHWVRRVGRQLQANSRTLRRF